MVCLGLAQHPQVDSAALCAEGAAGGVYHPLSCQGFQKLRSARIGKSEGVCDFLASLWTVAQAVQDASIISAGQCFHEEKSGHSRLSRATAGVRDGQSSSFGLVAGSLRSQRLQKSSLILEEVGVSHASDWLGWIGRCFLRTFQAARASA